MTVHKLDAESFVDAPGLLALDNKPLNPHPIINDIAARNQSRSQSICFGDCRCQTRYHSGS